MKMGENQDTSGVQHIVVERAWVLESAAWRTGSDKIVVWSWGVYLTTLNLSVLITKIGIIPTSQDYIGLKERIMQNLSHSRYLIKRQLWCLHFKVWTETSWHLRDLLKLAGTRLVCIFSFVGFYIPSKHFQIFWVFVDLLEIREGRDWRDGSVHWVTYNLWPSCQLFLFLFIFSLQSIK